MLHVKKYILLFIFGIVAVVAVKRNYEGFKVYKVIPKSEDEVRILEDVQNRVLGELWDDYVDVNHVVKIMVAPNKQGEFLDVLLKANMEVTEVIENLQRTIDNQLNPSKIQRSDSLLSLSWDQYYNLEAIYTWIDELAATYPNIVSNVTIGQTAENRDIKGVIIDYNPGRENKLVGMFEGTIHARERISAATVTYIIKEFLTSTDPKIRALAENFEWHIFPVTNPDGYSYTFTNDRMWRKNRNTDSFKNCTGIVDDMSNGVDLNRNFDFMWMSVGASNDSCSNTFAGTSPNSELETRSITNYVSSLKERGQLIYYIAFHSFTQLIIIPYSHLNSSADEERPSNYADMYEIAIRGSESIATRFNTTYRVGVSAEVMYPMSGTSFDWVKREAEVPITYLIELRDLGDFGFLLPADQILPTGLETMDGLVEMDKAAIALGYYKSSASGVLYSMTIMLLALSVHIIRN